MSVGSADEMRVWSRYCLDPGYIEAGQWKHWRDGYEEIAKMQQGMSKALRRGFADPDS